MLPGEIISYGGDLSERPLPPAKGNDREHILTHNYELVWWVATRSRSAAGRRRSIALEEVARGQLMPLASSPGTDADS